MCSKLQEKQAGDWLAYIYLYWHTEFGSSVDFFVYVPPIHFISLCKYPFKILQSPLNSSYQGERKV